MNKRSGFLLGVLVVMLLGCGAPKVVINHRANAEAAETTGHFEAATEAWELYFDQQLMAGQLVGPEEFARAGKVAFQANQLRLAENWLEQARDGGYADPDMYLKLAGIYNTQNNLSKELAALEYFYYRDHRP